MIPAKKMSNTNKDKSSTEDAEMPSAATTEVTNVEVKLVQDLSSPNAPLIIVEDKIEEENNKGEENSIKREKNLNAERAVQMSKNNKNQSSTEGTNVSSVTTTKVMKLGFQLVQDSNSLDAPIVIDEVNIELEKKKCIDKNIKAAKKGSNMRDAIKMSKVNKVASSTEEINVPTVTTTEVTNLEFQQNQDQDVNSPEAPIVIDEDSIEEEKMERKDEGIKATKKGSNIEEAIKMSKKNKDTHSPEEINVISVTTTVMTNLGFQQNQDVNSPDAPIIIDEDIEEENSNYIEKKIKGAKKGLMKHKTENWSKEDSNNVKSETAVPIVSTTEELNIDLIQVDDVDSPDEPIVLDDD